LKLILAYTSFRDLNNENFVLVKLHEPFLIPVQIRRTHIDVVKDDQNEFFKMVRVQWWVPVKKKGQIWMNDVYTKIVGTVSGNVIW